mgnify:CR=1 FL=1
MTSSPAPAAGDAEGTGPVAVQEPQVWQRHLGDPGDVGHGDREEVEHIGHGCAVEVAVGGHPAVLGHHGVVVGGGELPTGLQRPIIEKVAASALVAGPNATTDDVEREHTRQTVAQLVASVPNVRRLLDEGALGVIGARYLLEDSSVETLQTFGVD